MFLPTLAILLERLVPNILHTNCWQFHQLENQAIENCSLYGLTMQNNDSSISAKQHMDDFKRALGEFLKGLIEPSSDTLPPGLPTPVEPDAPRPKKVPKVTKPVRPLK